MSEKRYPEIISETLGEISKWVREVTRIREEDIGNADQVNQKLDEPINAVDVVYDHTSSGLSAINVQAALDEIKASIPPVPVAVVSVHKQIFTANGAYTPTAGMVYAIVEALGGGGGGGGTNGASAFGTGGGAGSYSKSVLSAATVGVSQVVTIGAAGAGGSTAGGNGVTGGATSLGSLVTTNGGVGGTGSTAASSQFAVVGVAGGAAGTGDLAIPGNNGGHAFSGNNGPSFSGAGANTVFGVGGASLVSTPSPTGTTGKSAAGYAAGGGGAMGTTHAGGPGTAGVIFITEYCSA